MPDMRGGKGRNGLPDRWGGAIIARFYPLLWQGWLRGERCAAREALPGSLEYLNSAGGD